MNRSHIQLSAAKAEPISEHDHVWESLITDAQTLAKNEPVMTSLAHMVVLDHQRFEDAVSFRIAQKIGGPDLSPLFLRDLIADAIDADPTIVHAARADIVAVYERDPSCTSFLEPILFFKGFLAVQTARIAHWYWRQNRRELARLLQMRVSEAFAVDIHPGAKIGCGLMIDHATGVVIGETAEIGDDVSMLHGVTLGGTGNDSGDRHPKIGDKVLIGANASILGNIRVGYRSRVGAGSVVLADVPACKTVVGVPARIVGDSGCCEPSRSMNHLL
jgi:serine O-acetyltransferase